MKKLLIKNKNNQNKKSGFTLIELLIYMGIFSIFLMITLQLFTSIFDIQLESEATSSVAGDGKYIMQRFSHDVNQSTSISIPASFGTESATLTFVSNSQSLTYSIADGDLILQNNTTGTVGQLNSLDTIVSDLSFIKLNGGGKDVVQISFTLTSVTTQRSGKEVVSYETSAGIR